MNIVLDKDGVELLRDDLFASGYYSQVWFD